jgi:hypothetical protein
MKLTEVMVSMLLKKGIISESKNVDLEIDIPQSMLKVDSLDKNSKITIRLKAENVTIRVEKGE